MKPKDTLSRRLADAESMGEEYATSVRKYKESKTMKSRFEIVIAWKIDPDFPYRVSINKTWSSGGSMEMQPRATFAFMRDARDYAEKLATKEKLKIVEWD